MPVALRPSSALSLRLARYGVPETIAKKAGRRLGYGTEGAVYELPGGKILKVNVMAERQHSIDKIYRKVHKKSWAAPMGAHGSLSGRGFWYVAPRLYPLPSRHIRALDDIGIMYLRHRRGGINKALFETYVEDRLANLPEGLAKVVRAARRAGYRDLHGANIMMTKDGKFKFIDVESIVRGRR